MRKKIAFVICIALLLSFALPLFSANAISTQLDHYKYLNIYDDGTVRPDQAITRGELAYAVYTLLDSSDKRLFTVTEASFSDVPVDYVYAKEIGYLASKGHLTGYTDGTFRPDDPVTRAEFATIIKRFKHLTDINSAARTPDIDGHWAMGAINTVITKGYMKGYPDGTFKPDNSVTRAETAKTLNNIFERKPNFKNFVKDPAIVALIQAGTITPIVYTKQVFPDLPTSHWAYAEMMEACISHQIKWDRVADVEVWIKLLEGYSYTGPAN